MPGLKTTSLGTGDYRWLLHTHGIRDSVTTVALDVSAFTAATHYPDGFFPCGLHMNIADPKDVKPYTGGAGEKLGYLMGDKAMNGDEKINATALFHGSIRTAYLPVQEGHPTEAPAGFYFTEGA